MAQAEGPSTSPSLVSVLRETGLDHPVFLVSEDPGFGEQLARELRDYGFKARSYVNLAVLNNASRGTVPGVVIVDSALLTGEAEILEMMVALSESAGRDIPLLFIGNDDDLAARVRAVRAGGSAYFTRPVNRTALIHKLHELNADDHDLPRNVVVVDSPEGGLTSVHRELTQSGVQSHYLDDPWQSLNAVREHTPDLILVNGDMNAPDSVELVQALRQEEAVFPTPVLVLTTKDKRRLDEGAAQVGIEGIVGLPVQGKDLLAIARARTRRAAGLKSAFRYLARRDPLSGLYSTRYFLEELRNTLSLARLGETRASLLYAHFPQLDAPEGETARREVMVAAGQMLNRRLPPPAIAARISESAVAIMVYTQDERELDDLSRRIRTGMAQAVQIAGEEPQCAVGVTLLGRSLRNAEDALERARRGAAILASEGGEHSPEETEAVSGYWDSTVTEALERGRFRLVYQPIANLSGHPASYYEVFVRMLDEEGQDVLPQEFLPSVMRLGLADRLDRWVTARAINVLVEQDGLEHQPTLFIKLFPDTVADPSFPGWLADRLRENHVSGDRLVFQVTQRAAASRLAETVDLARSLQDFGCGLAMEHYGDTPDHSELIGRIPLKFVKLSAALTQDLAESVANQKAIQAIAGQARAADARTIAALVQDASNLSTLWACGVEYIQGYFMQEPSDVFAEA